MPVAQEKTVFQWKRAVSGPSALLRPEMVKFASNLGYCAVDQEKAVFQWKPVSGPSTLLGPEMVKFAPNLVLVLYVDQEKAVFQWKRAVSGPSALLGPELVKFASNLCYCAVDQEKAVFQWRPVSGPSALSGARNGQICFEFVLLCCRPKKGRFSMETGRFKVVFQWKRAVSGPSALLGPELVKFASNLCYCAVDEERAAFHWKRAVSGPSAL